MKLALALVWLALALHSPQSRTVAAVQRGASCERPNPAASLMECDYRVGRDLHFVIAGVGEEDAGFTVLRTRGYEGDYYATFGIRHACVVIKPGAKPGETLADVTDMAFVSPKDGKIYPTWPQCADQSGGVAPRLLNRS